MKTGGDDLRGEIGRLARFLGIPLDGPRGDAIAAATRSDGTRTPARCLPRAARIAAEQSGR